jgi:cell division control protein 7
MIGEGTFSSVYLGVEGETAASSGRTSRRSFAVKRVHPTAALTRVSNEVSILRSIRTRAASLHKGGALNAEGTVFVPKLVGVFPQLRMYTSLVMEFVEHVPFLHFYESMEMSEIRRYVKALAEALSFIHSMGIVHRDVKPANFLRSLDGKRFYLIDFGLAYSLHSDARRGGEGSRSTSDWKAAPRSGTRGFRPPEVLLRSHTQSTAIDVWALGVVLLICLSRRYPFFTAPDDTAALLEIARFVGSDPIVAMGKPLQRTVSISPPITRRPWRHILVDELQVPRGSLIPPEAFELLTDLLTVNPAHRPTIKTVLSHEFFQILM